MTDFYVNFVPALLPVMVERLAISLTQGGLVTTGVLITSNFLQPLFGFFSDRKPAGMLLAASLLLSGLFMCLVGLAPTYYLFILLPMISGIGNAMYHPAGSLLCYRLDPHNRGFMMSLFSTAGALGYAIAPFVVAHMIVEFGSPSLLLLVLPVPCMMFLLGRLDRKTLPTQFSLPEKKADEKEDGQKKAILTLIMGMIFRAWGHLAFISYLPFLLKERGISYTRGAAILTLFLLLGAVFGLAAGKLSDRWGRRPIIALCMVVAFFSAVAFLLTSGWVSLVFLLLCGTMLGGCQPVMVVLGQELMPRQVGLASGISMGLVWGIGGLGIYLNGLVADRWGIVPSFWLASLVIGAGTLFSMLDKGERRGRHERLRQGS